MITTAKVNSRKIGIVRDDLFPFLGGGNKGRKIRYIEKDVKRKACNAVVTTGGIHSNHCRATAIMAAENGWSCTLVLHGDEKQFKNDNGNALFMRASGAKLLFVEPAEISSAMDSAMENYSHEGLKPYYIWGGGHTMEGGLAYIDAISELKKYCEAENWWPDRIYLPSGTGSTQAGILAGLDRERMDTSVIGISVARRRQQAEEVVREFYNKLCGHYEINSTGREVAVLDDYLCGGYEKADEKLKQLSQTSLATYGFTLDTTYSGKGFYGMKEIMKAEETDKNILFWHTGGVLNFLS